MRLVAGGHVELCKYVLDLGATTVKDALREVCYHGQEEPAKYLIEKGAHKSERALYLACCVSHLMMVNKCIKHGAVDWNRGLSGARVSVDDD